MRCGIAALDRLWTDDTAPPVAPTDRESVAAVQSLLIGHGYTDQDFSTLLLLQAKASGMELKAENVEVGDGLSS